MIWEWDFFLLTFPIHLTGCLMVAWAIGNLIQYLRGR